MRSKKRSSNFELLMTLRNNAEAGTRSVLPIHPIKYNRSGQNKLVHDEELIKAEHLSMVKSQASTSYSNLSSTSLFQLPDRASCRQSDQFSNSRREKGLVSSSYSSATVRFLTAITDRLRKQSESSNAEFQYRTNYGALQRCLTCTYL